MEFGQRFDFPFRREIHLDDLHRPQTQCLEPLFPELSPLPFLVHARMSVEIVMALEAHRFCVLRIEPDRMQAPTVEVRALKPGVVPIKTLFTISTYPPRARPDKPREHPVEVVECHFARFSFTSATI